MAKTVAQPERMSRKSLIDSLRGELARRTKNDMSVCKLAAATGVFCKGFRRYSDEELKERYGWIVRRNPDAPRETIEDIADRWQLARQEVENVPLACDVQQLEHDTCGGWDDFSNEDLARFALELTGRSIVVQPE
jgi:hypothetical protein